MAQENKRTFYTLLANTLVSSVTNTFVWFALTFWTFLETQSVLATSWVAGIFAVSNMASAFFFGGVVDHNRKKTAMIYSSSASLLFYILGAVVFFSSDPTAFTNPGSLPLWALIVTLMLGSVAGNLRMIALSTTVSLLFTEDRDKANGMVGMVNGASFAVTSILSGVTIGFFGMHVAIYAALIATAVTLLHLFTISIPEKEIFHAEDAPKKLDIKGTIAIMSGISGLFALIFFTTFNNFLGGVFMSLMDAYGLSLMRVEAWGLMLSLLSFGFILGGIVIAKFGLGHNPLKRMLMVNVITWTTCIFFTIQPSIILLGIGMLIWMMLMPVIESGEHTVIQKVVPFERQGRVFGFAQSVESAATPVTTFLIGPIAQFMFIPFMTTGAGVEFIGDWFGVGPARGIALVFTTAGIIGLIITLLAFRSRAYGELSKEFVAAS
ncbi:MAG TPA: MFS transporter [Candidatus Paceibacterota bacterium]